MAEGTTIVIITLHTIDTTAHTEQDTTMDITHTINMGSLIQTVMEAITDTAITKTYK